MASNNVAKKDGEIKTVVVSNLTEVHKPAVIDLHGAYDRMDKNNKHAADIMRTCGSKAAIDHMMSSGGDYATMRMMFG